VARSEGAAPVDDGREDAGVNEWLELVEAALAGLHHALNNRVSSLTAMVQLLRMSDAEGAGENLENLVAEVPRLEESSRVARLLSGDGSRGEESLVVSDALSDALAIHRFLHGIRDVEVAVVPVASVEPVRVERWALVRVLTLLLNEAKRLAIDLGAPVRALVKSDAQWVSVEFCVAPSSVDELPGSGRGKYADAVARRFGGEVSRRPGAVELLIPTLKVRRAAMR
jgi:hypothetical protein